MTSQEISIDANVFVSALIPSEPDHKSALSLMEKIDSLQLAIYDPAIVVFEVESALNRKIWEGILTPDEVNRLSDIFFEFPLLLQWQQGLLKKARHTARVLSMRGFYDATYLSLAIMRGIPLVTLDRELQRKGRTLFDEIYYPEEFLKKWEDE